MEDAKKFRAALKDPSTIAQQASLVLPYHQRYEGRRVFDDELAIQFKACELVQKALSVSDGFSLVGEDIDSLSPTCSHPLAISVRVSGDRFKSEHEAVLERDLYRIINYADGVKHKGQQDEVTLRISHAAQEAGFNLKALAALVHAGLKSEYAEIIEDLNVEIISRPADLPSLWELAKQVFADRHARLQNLRDDQVNHFFSCTICQSNSPHHICIIAPQRSGACGTVDYYSATTSADLNPFGPNRLVEKGEPEGDRLGQWEGVNDFVYEASNGKLSEYNLYSIVDNPPPFSDCMECISALIPSLNAVVVLDRRFTGLTPLGMSFAETQDCIVKGASVTGLMGHSRVNIIEEDYLREEGDIKRIIWMPSVLKKDISVQFAKKAKTMGEPDLLDKIADETIAVSEEDTVAYNVSRNHPFSQLPPVI